MGAISKVVLFEGGCQDLYTSIFFEMHNLRYAGISIFLELNFLFHPFAVLFSCKGCSQHEYSLVASDSS